MTYQSSKVEYQGTEAAKLKKEEKTTTTFLIDGSGSMCYKGNTVSGAVAESVNKISKLDNSENKVVLFSDNNPSLIFSGKKALNIEVIEAIEKGLQGPSNLAPSLNLANKLTAEVEGKQKLVIITDGDLHDAKESEEKLKSLINLNPNVKISAVIINDMFGNKLTQMEEMLKKSGNKSVDVQVVRRSKDTKSIDQNLVDTIFEVVTGKKNPDSKVNSQEVILGEFKELAIELSQIQNGRKNLERDIGQFKDYKSQFLQDIKNMSDGLDNRSKALEERTNNLTEKMLKLSKKLG